MEEDLGSALIGGSIFLFMILPIVIMSRNRKKRKKVFLQSLSEIATQNNGQLNHHEIFHSFGIGIDEARNFIFFYRQSKGSEIKHFVDLNQVQSCRILNTSRTFETKNGNLKIIDQLELSFIPSTKGEAEIKLEFFNQDVDVQLNGELQSIEKWSKLINDRLKHKQ